MWYNDETLGGRFANKLRMCLSQKKFRNLIVDDYSIRDDGSGMWDFSYKGMNFVLEWFYSSNGNNIDVYFDCTSVDTVNGTIDTTSYNYTFDDTINDSGIENFIYELDNLITDCYIGKNINFIYKKVDRLYNDIKSLEGHGNKDVLIDILKQYDLI